VWPGSVFTVTTFDRFARNMAEANQILTDVSDRGVLFGLGGSFYGVVLHGLLDMGGKVFPGDGGHGHTPLVWSAVLGASAQPA
jgi:hypothetical protein